MMRVDERAYFDRILRDWGHDVLLQRRDSQDDYSDKFERHTVRSSIATALTLFRGMEFPPEGETTDHGLIFYFRHNAKPRSGDRIYNTDLREADTEWNGWQIFEVTDVYPVRGRLGRIAYYAVRAERRRPT